MNVGELKTLIAKLPDSAPVDISLMNSEHGWGVGQCDAEITVLYTDEKCTMSTAFLSIEVNATSNTLRYLSEAL